MIDILSSGQGEPDALILWIIFMICLYGGGDKSYGMKDLARWGIKANGLQHQKNLWKNCVHVNESKVGVGDVLFSKLALI